MADILAEIKKIAKEDKLTYGTNETLKAIKKGEAKRVFTASNCLKGVKEDIKRFKDISKFDLVELDMPNDEFGVVCKKQFLISVACEKKK